MLAKTILLVDDNLIQATVRRTILERSGYSVITSLHPAAALEHLRAVKSPSRIDLIVTDHLMPGMNGSTFVREVRSIQPEIPVLVVSGMEEARYEYEDLHVEFRVKPLQPDLLLQSIRQMVGQPESADRFTAVAAPATA